MCKIFLKVSYLLHADWHVHRVEAAGGEVRGAGYCAVVWVGCEGWPGVQEQAGLTGSVTLF